MIRSFAFALALAGAAAVGLALSMAGAAVALGGVIEYSIASQMANYSPVTATGVDSFALWSGTGDPILTGSNILPGLGVLGPSEWVASRSWTYNIDGNAYTGGVASANAITGTGGGFEITLVPDMSALTTFTIYTRSYGGTTQYSVGDTVSGDYYQIGSTVSPEFSRLTIQAVGEPFVFRQQFVSASVYDVSTVLGGVTAKVEVVPEPEYWLAGLILATGAGLYIVIVWGSALFVSKGDGDKRD